MATRTMLAAVWLLALLFLTTATSAQIWQGATYNAIVTRVVDGDTVEVRLGDRVETVRYIGINTPEIHHPTRGGEPYRDAARAANQQLVEGRTVRLVLDVQPRDRDGRLLAYVYVDGQLVNAELVRSGYAEAATYPPNVKHHAELVELQRRARQERAGLWGHPEAVRAHRPRQSGVAGVRNVHVYLHSDDPGWMQRPPEDLVYFESAEQARAAGYTHSMDYHRLAARERQALAGGSEPFVSTLSQPGRPARSAPAPAERRERPRPEASDAAEPDPSAVVDWLLSRRDKGPSVGSSRGSDANVKGDTRGDGPNVAPHTRSAPRGRP
jgi:micrococcal nuclease